MSGGTSALLRVQLEDHTVSTATGTRRAVDSSPLVIAGKGQSAWLHMPDGAATGPLPLLVVLHGAGKNRMWDLREVRDSGLEDSIGFNLT